MRVDRSGAGIGARRRGRRGLLQGTIGAFQDARDCPLRGRLADDAVGQGPEISDADRRARPLAMSTRAPASKKQETYRSEEHTSELQSLMRISYAVFCLKKKKQKPTKITTYDQANNSKPREQEHRSTHNS